MSNLEYNYKEHIQDVRYENLNDDPVEGVMACGYLPKPPEVKYHKFSYYGGFLVLMGKGSYTDDTGVTVPIGPGDFVQRRPGISHTTTVEAGEPWLEFYVCFGTGLYKLLVSLRIMDDSPVLHPGLSPDLTSACEMLLHRFKTTGAEDKQGLFIDIQQLIQKINRKAVSASMTTDQELFVREISERLSRDFEERIDYHHLAEGYGMSYDHMRKLFKSQTGLSLTKYRIQKRINYAKGLLHDRNRSIKSIALQLGFNDGYELSKQFKQYTGVSPKKFREQDGH